MNDKPMPETIAAWRFRPEKADEWIYGGWSGDHDHKTTSYTRTDVAQAMVAAAYDAAAGVLVGYSPLYDGFGGSYREVNVDGEIVYDIRTLTPTDAKAALDRIVQEAVREALQVKPLVWVHRPDEPQGYTWKARKPFGSAYYLHEKDGLHSWGEGYIPLEEAKATAQADHTRRILAALKGGEA